MSATRWLSALLLVTLILSSAPAAVSAAPAAAPALQEPAATGSTSYLLLVTPPKVSIAASTGAMQVAGHFNIEHARYYSMIQARLAAWQQQGAITGFSAEPAAYAFAIRGATPSVLGDLAALGQLQPMGDLSAAAVDGLSRAYQENLQAAIAAAVHPQLASARPAAAPLAAPSSAHSAAVPKPGFTAAGVMVKTNGLSPSFDIQLNSNEVNGRIAAGTYVTATLKASTGVVKGIAYDIGSGGWVHLDLEDAYGNPVFVGAGDILEVEVPGLLTIPVVDLHTSINSAEKKATGVAPANITNQDSNLRPWLNLSVAQSSYITTTPSGTFDVETNDVPPGQTWQLLFANSESNNTFVRGEIPVLVLRGDYEDYSGFYDDDDARVSGAVIDANALLTVTLTRVGSPTIVNYTRSDENSAFSMHLYDQYFNEVAILAGDTVQVTGGGVTLSATVPAFEVDSNASSDTVTGTTNAIVVTDTINLTQTLAIFPDGVSEGSPAGFGKLALAPNGSFSVGNDFYLGADPTSTSRRLDWPPGVMGHLRYVNADGNVIFAGFYAGSPDPILSLRGQGNYLADNLVTGQAYVNGEGLVTLLGANNVVKARNFVYANPLLSYSFRDAYGNPLPIADGDSVVATFAGRTTTVKAPVFTITANALTGVVTGRITGAPVTTTTLDAPQSLVVYPPAGSPAYPINVQPDPNGDFSADFGPTPFVPGAEGYVKYVDANHNTVFAKWQVPFDRPILSLRGLYGYGDENFVGITLPNYAPQSPCTKTIFIAVKAQDNTVRWQRTMAACEPSLELHLSGSYGSPINLNAGDTVQATFEGKTATAVVPSFAVTSDPRTSTVSGQTNATVTNSDPAFTQTLAIWPEGLNNLQMGKFVLVSAMAFSATNPFYLGADPGGGTADLFWEPGDQGHLRYIDAEGNSIYGTFAAVTDQPILDIQKGSNYVEGRTPVSSGPVTVTVRSGSAVKGVGSAMTDLGGMFDMEIYDGVGNPIRIAEGDVVEFTPPLTTVVVPPLTAIVDVDNDRISGKGPANALLNVSLDDDYWYYGSMTVATDKDGNYALDLRGLIDISPNMWGWLEYRNPDGQTIYIGQSAGTYLEGGLNTSRVWGQAPVPGTPVQVTLQRAGTVIGRDTLVADDEYGTYVAFLIDASGRPVIQLPGDVLSANFGSGGSRSFTLAPLQMSVDLAANTVRGVGPAASRLGVTVWYEPPDEEERLDMTVLTDENGQWSVDLNTWMFGIDAGDPVDLVYMTDGSDATWLGAVAPVFWVRSTSEYEVNSIDESNVVNNLVTGYAAPYAPVMVTLKRNGGVLAFVTQEADNWGYYMAYLYDRNGLDADIMPGDVVEVQSVSGPPVSVSVPIMTAVVDRLARMITGVGPANAAMGLHYYPGVNETVHTNADGTFATTFRNITAASIGSGAVVLTYNEPQGNWIRSSTGQPAVPPANLEIRWGSDYYGYAYGGYLAHAVSGSAGAPVTQVQLTLHRGGMIIATGAVMSDQYGDFTAALRDSDGQPVDIVGGDLIEMSAGEVTRSLTVPEMTAQANLESLTLYGTGPANAPMMVWGAVCDEELGPPIYDLTVDPNGKWVLPCPGLEHGDAGVITVQDLQGNRTHLNWSVPIVRAQLNGNYVEGVLIPETEVSVQLWRLNVMVAETMVTASEDNGMFWAQFLGSGGSPFIILPNDTVVVAYENQSITVPVVSLSASVDNAADKVTGTGPASQELEVAVVSSGWAARSLDEAWVERHVTTAGDGAYVADFAGVRDIQGGDGVAVWHTNADGNEVYLEHSAPLVRINLGSDIVDGYATPNSIASIVLKRGGSVIASTKAPTGMYGAFSAFFLDGEGNVINLVAGDVVEVTASPTVASSAVGLTAVVDPTLDRITGSAPAGAAVLVTAYTCEPWHCFGYSATAIAGGDGSYSLNLAGIFNLDLTSYAYVQVVDGVGNMTSFTSTPSALPQLTDAERSLQDEGATLLASAFGTGNPGNLTPPMVVNSVGAGKLILIANGGTLVVTAPDGTIMRSENGYLTVANPLSGRWLVQVLIGGGGPFDNGTQYTMAAGQGLYSVYMPIVKLLTKK